MEMTAPRLCERLSHCGHVNGKKTLPETPIFESYLVQLTNVMSMPNRSVINVIRPNISISEGFLHFEIDAAVGEFIEILNFQRQ